MRLLIEGFDYENSPKAQELLAKLPHDSESNSANCVGYFFHKKLADFVFVLPKVLLNEQNKIFGEFSPEEMVDFDDFATKKLSRSRQIFIREFALWIYRAIDVFAKTNPESTIVLPQQKMPLAGTPNAQKSATFLDIIIALLQFYRENQTLFTQILKIAHSGFEKIDWRRTISKQLPILQDGVPIYANPVNKRRQINFDEELLVIFFSILNYVREKFGFSVQISYGFELITGTRFQQYLRGNGKARLLQIKGKYFSDKLRRLWELCFAFFNANPLTGTLQKEEKLLARDFNIVFESMIDELIGDKSLADEKNQRDGKIVDHIFRYKNLTSPETCGNEIFYIGDSKYYKTGSMVGEKSIYKQWTYARNVIQRNLDIFYGNAEPRERKIRDDFTEGYDVIPNFFIRAQVDETPNFNEKLEFAETGENPRISRHFPNRLFDRDTLLLMEYNVNFLHIIALYARKNELQKLAWKNKVRAQFRQKIQKILSEKYEFYWLKTEKSESEISQFFDAHFRQILGKIYKPTAKGDCFLLALDKQKNFEKENEQILTICHSFFEVKTYSLGNE